MKDLRPTLNGDVLRRTKMLAMREAGAKLREIGAAFGVTHQRVSQILDGLHQGRNEKFKYRLAESLRRFKAGETPEEISIVLKVSAGRVRTYLWLTKAHK